MNSPSSLSYLQLGLFLTSNWKGKSSVRPRPAEQRETIVTCCQELTFCGLIVIMWCWVFDPMPLTVQVIFQTALQRLGWNFPPRTNQLTAVNQWDAHRRRSSGRFPHQRAQWLQLSLRKEGQGCRDLSLSRLSVTQIQQDPSASATWTVSPFFNQLY